MSSDKKSKSLPKKSKTFKKLLKYIDKVLTDDDSYERKYVAKLLKHNKTKKSKKNKKSENKGIRDFVATKKLCCKVIDIEKIKKEMSQLDESFMDMLMRLIKEKGMKASDFYNAAGFSRQKFYKMKEPNYHPPKITAVACALALKLDLDESRRLLYTAGYVLTRSSEFDITIDYCIRNKIYDIDTINIFLSELKQDLIGYKEKVIEE